MNYLDTAKKAREEYRRSKRQNDGVPEPSPQTVDSIIDDKVVAVLIDSEILGAPLWLSFDPRFDPADAIPVFYADELDLLKNKPISTLRKAYETKKASGLRTLVRQ